MVGVLDAETVGRNQAEDGVEPDDWKQGGGDGCGEGVADPVGKRRRGQQAAGGEQGPMSKVRGRQGGTSG